MAQRHGFFDIQLGGAGQFDPALRQGVQDADFNGTPAAGAPVPWDESELARHWKMQWPSEFDVMLVV